MNKVKNTIGWANFTWNPITGCLNNCFYCYARKMFQRFGKPFYPKFHYTRLSEPLKINKPSKIFVCSVSDFWGEGTKQIWREEVYNVIKACPNHIFQILTKQPQNINDEDHIPDNVWIGISVTDWLDWGKVAKFISKKLDNLKFISIEPILGRIDTCYFLLFDWIILGGLTPKPVHKAEWIRQFLFINSKIKKPIFMKDNLKPIWKGKLLREFPKKRGDYETHS